MKPRNEQALRCAIYTRKSSEEGLEQEFNSLHAQREACEAYVRSQQGEGWRLRKMAYDDGGLSGATMERPALKQLLADIEEGLVDVVVVYKVDRLTRSLSDFARMVEIFDGHGVSFVAVTQQFNTTTSMGRLTLNVLLSFAQFEREVTGERIRDKIAASKRKGMWMGGLVPLGYEVRERQLVVVESEAATVRHIFQRYCELGSVRLLKQELDRDRCKQRLLARRALAFGDVALGNAHVLTGPTAMTWPEVAARLTQVLGRPISYDAVSIEERRAQLETGGLAPWRVELVLGLDEINRSDLYATPTDGVRLLTGHSPRTIEDYIEGNRSAFS